MYYMYEILHKMHGYTRVHIMCMNDHLEGHPYSSTCMRTTWLHPPAGGCSCWYQIDSHRASNQLIPSHQHGWDSMMSACVSIYIDIIIIDVHLLMMIVYQCTLIECESYDDESENIMMRRKNSLSFSSWRETIVWTRSNHKLIPQ